VAQLVVIALAAVFGWSAYAEAAKFESQHGRGPGGVSVRLCGLVGALAGLIAARFVAPVLVAAVAGYGGWVGATRFERQNRDRLFGISAMLYASACFFAGLFGALIFGAGSSAIMCVFAELAGALLLERDQNDALRAENETLHASPRPGPTAAPLAPKPAPLAPQPAPLAPQPARKTFLFGPPQVAPAQGPPSRWSQSVVGHDQTDHLLPNRHDARPRPPGDHDLLPERR
jgi:hypothetical protein